MKGGRFQLEHAPAEEPGMLMTSMIDVIFILLIFFVSVSQIRESKFEVDLPETKGAQSEPEAPGKIEHLNVVITADDTVFIQDERVEVGPALEDLLRGMVADQGEELRVRVRSDEQSRSGTMLRVLGLLSEVGLNRVEFAISPDTTGERGERG